LIVDAHVHAFSEVRGMTGRGPVRGIGFGRVTVGSERLPLMPPAFEGTSFTADTLLACMDWAGVDRAILLQGAFFGECNGYVAAACRSHPDRLVGVAFADPWSPGTRESLERAADAGVFRGLKLECSVDTGLLGLHPGARIDDGELEWLWETLERLGWILVVDLGKPGSASYQTDALRAVAASRPGLRIVIAHLGQPGPDLDRDPRMMELWRSQVSLGLLPNVWFDTAALPAYFAEEGFPWPGASAFLRRAMRAVGVRKIVWGTDIPGLLTQGTYPQLRRHCEDALGFLSPADRDLVFGGTARELFAIH